MLVAESPCTSTELNYCDPIPQQEKSPVRYLLVRYNTDTQEYLYWQKNSWTSIRANAHTYESLGKIFNIMDYMGFITVEGAYVHYFPMQV